MLRHKYLAQKDGARKQSSEGHLPRATCDAALAAVPGAPNQVCRTANGAPPRGAGNEPPGHRSQAGPGQNPYTSANALALA
ncbi:hypothetical protein [Hymenobacter sp.]|uniref:hypothetical protein n=1 Tax=Hymenobacter sp. TaxID=1898978 RepID=UPI00286D28EE|nr:hypothetical protein [Hymenobacter sp.]